MEPLLSKLDSHEMIFDPDNFNKIIDKRKNKLEKIASQNSVNSDMDILEERIEIDPSSPRRHSPSKANKKSFLRQESLKKRSSLLLTNKFITSVLNSPLSTDSSVVLRWSIENQAFSTLAFHPTRVDRQLDIEDVTDLLAHIKKSQYYKPYAGLKTLICLPTGFLMLFFFVIFEWLPDKTNKDRMLKASLSVALLFLVLLFLTAIVICFYGVRALGRRYLKREQDFSKIAAAWAEKMGLERKGIDIQVGNYGAYILLETRPVRVDEHEVREIRESGLLQSIHDYHKSRGSIRRLDLFEPYDSFGEPEINKRTIEGDKEIDDSIDIEAPGILHPEQEFNESIPSLDIDSSFRYKRNFVQEPDSQVFKEENKPRSSLKKTQNQNQMVLDRDLLSDKNKDTDGSGSQTQATKIQPKDEKEKKEAERISLPEEPILEVKESGGPSEETKNGPETSLDNQNQTEDKDEYYTVNDDFVSVQEGTVINGDAGESLQEAKQDTEAPEIAETEESFQSIQEDKTNDAEISTSLKEPLEEKPSETTAENKVNSSGIPDEDVDDFKSMATMEDDEFKSCMGTELGDA